MLHFLSMSTENLSLVPRPRPAFCRSRVVRAWERGYENLFKKYNGLERLTGLTLLHFHKKINIEEIVQLFAIKHPRHIKLSSILSD